MCTLIAGLGVLGPGTLAVAANRDEAPERPSDAPGILSSAPRVVGGRDVVAGGTWLATREGFAVVALLNRRGGPPSPSPVERPPRSRGLLALDAARAATSAAEEFPDAALAVAERSVARHPYAPFTLVGLTTRRGWLLSHDGRDRRVEEIPPGWHVLTHADLDDRDEPRTRGLIEELRGFSPAGADECARGLLRRLALHGEEAAVCIHTGRMVTVSASVIVLGAAGDRYLHVEGRPCERPATDLSGRLHPGG